MGTCANVRQFADDEEDEVIPNFIWFLTCDCRVLGNGTCANVIVSSNVLPLDEVSLRFQNI